MLEKRTEPHLGSTARPIYDLLAEYPGVESSTAEIAAELNEALTDTLMKLRNLLKAGYVQKTVAYKGRGGVRWFVKPQSEASHS